MSIGAILDHIADDYNGEWEGHQLRLDCPLCGKRKLDISLGDERPVLLASCFNGDCQGKGAEILERLGLPTGDLTAEELAEVELGREAGAPPASADVLNTAYYQWLRACPLSAADLKSLKARGLTDDVITRNGYGSWTGRHDPKALPGGPDVPGVYFEGDKRRVALNDPRFAGVLVPVRDRDGRVVGLKVRLHKPDDKGKMRVFSSAEWGGPRGPFAVHCPKGLPSKCPRLLVVEGELKADVVFALTGQPVVGVPGANGGVARLRPLLKALGVKSVGLAFDQDKAGHHAALNYFKELYEDHSPDVLTWDQKHKGLDDLVAAGLSPKTLTADDALDYLGRLEQGRPLTPKPPPGVRPAAMKRRRGRPEGVSAAALMKREFPPLEVLIPGVLPAGLSVLAGKTKIGKSWMGLDIALSFAAGRPVLFGEYAEKRGGVILLALEDSERRLQDRILTMCGDSPVPDDCLIFHSGSKWPVRDTTAGLEELGRLLDERPGTRLIIIDTLHKFQSPKAEKGRGSGYEADYDAVTTLHDFASERGVSILALHHAKKVGEEDPFDDILGTTGTQAPFDTMLVLKREPDSLNGMLYVKGRDVEQQAFVVQFHEEGCRWKIVATEAERKKVASSQETLRAILAGAAVPVPATEAEARMQDAGFTKKQTRTARERLGVLVEWGNDAAGKRCRVWSLPGVSKAA